MPTPVSSSVTLSPSAPPVFGSDNSARSLPLIIGSVASIVVLVFTNILQLLLWWVSLYSIPQVFPFNMTLIMRSCLLPWQSPTYSMHLVNCRKTSALTVHMYCALFTVPASLSVCIVLPVNAVLRPDNKEAVALDVSFSWTQWCHFLLCQDEVCEWISGRLWLDFISWSTLYHFLMSLCEIHHCSIMCRGMGELHHTLCMLCVHCTGK